MRRALFLFSLTCLFSLALPVARAAAPEAVSLKAADGLVLKGGWVRSDKPANRAVLLLHFLEDFPLSEIATITAVPLGTVKSRLHHAKRALTVI